MRLLSNDDVRGHKDVKRVMVWDEITDCFYFTWVQGFKPGPAAMQKLQILLDEEGYGNPNPGDDSYQGDWEVTSDFAFEAHQSEDECWVAETRSRGDQRELSVVMVFPHHPDDEIVDGHPDVVE